MVATRPPARLLVPADRRPSRERLMASPPFFLRDPAQVPPDAPPRLLSFAGDGFMADFLAAVAQPRTLPRLLPWRDWAEPPASLLDLHGQPRYRSADIARRPVAPAIDIDAAEGPAMDADGIPHGNANGEQLTTPAWLRKLYLPLHERFTLLAFDLVCGAAGWPRVARSRIKGSGAVIRRLIPDTAATRWEDWIAVDDKHGAWLDCLPAHLHAEAAPPDPAAFAPPPRLEARLRALFGLGDGTPLPPLALTSQPLALVPPDAGQAAEHCTLFGYLPVFSAAREIATDALDTGTVAEIAARLAERTRSRLDSLFAGAATLRDSAVPRLRSLLAATILPARPGTADSASADALLVTLAATAPSGLGGASGPIARGIDLTLREAIGRLWHAATAPATAVADIAGAPADAASLWATSGAANAASRTGLFAGLPDPDPLTPGNQAAAWLAGGASGSAWDTLVRLRLHQLVDAWLAGAPLPAPTLGGASLIDEDDLALLALTGLLRLRGCRLALAARINRHLFGDDKAAALQAIGADGHLDYGLAALAETIDAFLVQENLRGTAASSQPPWPALGLTPAWALAAHADGAALAGLYAHFDDGLASAGNAAIDALDLRTHAVEQAIGAAITRAGATPGLAASGFRLAEQPVRGLLALPGLRGNAATFAAFRNAAADAYLADAARLALPEARAGSAQPRLRFDAEHLYAAWGWVRVAGRSPCEPDRIVWTRATEPFSIADPTDLLGARPASIQMPDIGRLLRDIPRLARARAQPFAGVASPPGSGVTVGGEMADTRRDFGLGMICNFGIPIFTICALILFKIIFTILIALPSFSWMLFLKICLPFPKRGS